MVTMVTVVAILEPECISMTITNETSYNCTNLGAPSNNMNLAEGNFTIIYETQPPTTEWGNLLTQFPIYLLRETEQMLHDQWLLCEHYIKTKYGKGSSSM